jgi:NAD(P)-dependent dehydrogenase (short-subunit alcohol dehydrogenase family)
MVLKSSLAKAAAGRKTMAKTWFITGSSSGFGRALAEQALARGDGVALTARDPSKVADLVERHPGRAHAIRLDVTAPVEVRQAVAEAFDRLGRVDVVVNNAGYGLFGALEEVSDAQIRRQFDTHVFGAIEVIRAMTPRLREQGGGHFINMSSMVGLQSMPLTAVYGAVKHAIEGLSEGLAAELAEQGIKVTILEPGHFQTDFSGRSMDIAMPSERYAHILPRLMARFEGFPHGEPRGVAEAMLAVADMDDPPLRLALGADAVDVGRDSLRRKLEAIDAWEATSVAAGKLPAEVA